jgi:uncharacterized protein
MEKYYFSYKEIHETIQKSAKDIVASGFEADYILAIGGGGFIPARLLRTFLEKPIITVTLSRYNSKNEAVNIPIKQQWIDNIHFDLNNKKVLLVDEVDDCRTTLEYCIKELLKSYNIDLSVFVLHNKIKEKHGVIPSEVKHIFIGKDIENKWINYPWDAMDINAHELMTKTPLKIKEKELEGKYRA